MKCRVCSTRLLHAYPMERSFSSRALLQQAIIHPSGSRALSSRFGPLLFVFDLGQRIDFNLYDNATSYLKSSFQLPSICTRKGRSMCTMVWRMLLSAWLVSNCDGQMPQYERCHV